MDIFRYDESLRQKGFCRIAGIDEAGRGPLAGPVVASAVVMPDGKTIKGLRDSKKVPEAERESLFDDILGCCLDIGVGIVDAGEIDKINILRATKHAMEEAIKALSAEPDLLLIDAVKLPHVHIKQISPIKGESVSASIAAASIVAKVTRDRLMQQYHEIYPEYGFEKHKGYCTKEHMEKLLSYGPCPIHRKSFDKVMDLALPFKEQ
ncbi:MAG: ribonuclease HII [Thermodesulfovibrionales bacterium]|nr:ribonuclease HII [Thermodesulfovibrionales bacterium]